MTALKLNFAAPGDVSLTGSGTLAISFPAPPAMELAAVGIQGPASPGGGVSDGDKGGIVVTGSGAVWTVKAGSITDLMLGASAIALFAAAIHTHTIANITGLQAALDGKAAASHTHVAADVTDFAVTTRATDLTGYVAAGSRIALAAGDTILGAFGKLGKWVADLAAVAFSGSASDLTAGTLPAARFDDTAHGNRAGGTLHANVVPAGAAGFMTGADKTKLDGVATGATANATDAALRDRATHTGTQLAATISDLAAAVAATPAVTANTAKVTNATHTGDVTGATALTIANDAVTNAKAANMATATIKGRATAGTGDPEDLTGTQATALLDVFTSGAKGLAPASGGGTTNFLRADGTWAAPGGGGSPGGSTGKVQYNNAGAFAGAADVEIEGGQLRLPAIATPATPASGGVKLFGQSLAGRMLPTCLGPSGLQSPLQPIISRSRIRLYVVVGNGGADVNLGFALSTTGTTAAVNWAATNFRTRMSWRRFGITTASTTAVCGMRGNASMFTVGADIANAGGFYLAWTFSPGTGVANANHRLFVGLRASVAAPTDVDPSSVVNIVGVGYDTADTNMQIMHNDGSGTATKIDLGGSFPKPSADATKAYRIELFSPPGTTQSVGYLLTDLETGATASGTVTTDLPSTTTGLNVYSQMSVGGTSSVVGLDHGLVYMETDN